jgi:serine palmitoyltransferase
MRPWIDEQFRFADVHVDLERDIPDFLGTEASVIYSQGFSTIPCVLSAFAKRVDIIIAGHSINFTIQKVSLLRVGQVKI